MAMKRVGGRGRGWSDGGDGRVGFGAEPSGSHQSLPTRAPLRSPRSREAHDRGTRRSRRFLAGLVVGCVLLAAGRPVYGPYIDRFGETGDKGVIAVVKTSLRKRAERHDLTTLPRSWGHHRDGPDGEGEVVGEVVGALRPNAALGPLALPPLVGAARVAPARRGRPAATTRTTGRMVQAFHIHFKF